MCRKIRDRIDEGATVTTSTLPPRPDPKRIEAYLILRISLAESETFAADRATAILELCAEIEWLEERNQVTPARICFRCTPPTLDLSPDEILAIITAYRETESAVIELFSAMKSAERERCAKIADDFALKCTCAKQIAETIRKEPGHQTEEGSPLR